MLRVGTHRSGDHDLRDLGDSGSVQQLDAYAGVLVEVSARRCSVGPNPPDHGGEVDDGIGRRHREQSIYLAAFAEVACLSAHGDHPSRAFLQSGRDSSPEEARPTSHQDSGASKVHRRQGLLVRIARHRADARHTRQASRSAPGGNNERPMGDADYH